MCRLLALDRELLRALGAPHTAPAPGVAILVAAPRARQVLFYCYYYYIYIYIISNNLPPPKSASDPSSLHAEEERSVNLTNFDLKLLSDCGEKLTNI